MTADSIPGFAPGERRRDVVSSVWPPRADWPACFPAGRSRTPPPSASSRARNARRTAKRRNVAAGQNAKGRSANVRTVRSPAERTAAFPDNSAWTPRAVTDRSQLGVNAFPRSPAPARRGSVVATLTASAGRRTASERVQAASISPTAVRVHVRADNAHLPPDVGATWPESLTL
jgi:hypothetical protein